jgi:hypothetical protein
MTRDRDTPHAPDFRSVGHCQVLCVVAGDPANPLTAQRRAGLAPVTTTLVRQVEAQTGTIQSTSWERPLPAYRHPSACRVRGMTRVSRLQMRTRVLNGEWDATFRTWYPGFRAHAQPTAV